MSEHLANGQFAAKEVSAESAPKRKKCKPRGRPFAKGNPGKPPGTQNKVTREVKGNPTSTAWAFLSVMDGHVSMTYCVVPLPPGF